LDYFRLQCKNAATTLCAKQNSQNTGHDSTGLRGDSMTFQFVDEENIRFHIHCQSDSLGLASMKSGMQRSERR
jgi:hypothetical protein